MRWSFCADTHRNTTWPDKPNEDLCWFDPSAGAAMVLDGVSRDRQDGKYPVPSPARRASEVFAAAAARVLTNGAIAPLDRLQRAAQAGNEAVAAMNRGADADFLPGTVGILALLTADALHYAYLGDCNGLLLRDGAAQLFTSPQTEAVHQHRGEFSAHEIRAHICNNPQHPCGYGVWTGQSAARHFLRTGTLPLRSGDRVLLCTDGLNPFLRDTPDFASLDTATLFARAMAYQPLARMDDRTAVLAQGI